MATTEQWDAFFDPDERPGPEAIAELDSIEDPRDGTATVWDPRSIEEENNRALAWISLDSDYHVSLEGWR